MPEHKFSVSQQLDLSAPTAKSQEPDLAWTKDLQATWCEEKYNKQKRAEQERSKSKLEN